MTVTTSFDEEFASAKDWALMYRAAGLQAVPAVSPREDALNYKRPALPWKEFEDALIPEATIERWYDVGGPHRGRTNLGLITGHCSGGVFCVDLDVKEGSKADAWWQGLLEVHNNGLEPETPWQRTGGGGRQVLFRAPDGWVPPTFKTPVGIDIRGQGGFMVAPPSMHASGKRYEWAPGCAPHEIEIEAAPDWLIEAIEHLREQHGGSPAGAQRERVKPDAAKNDFGIDIDDREEKLRNMVWAAVVDLYRDCPIMPPKTEQDEIKGRLWQQYLSTTKSRLVRPGVGNGDLLEAEGRGWSELDRKWRYAIKKWEKEVKAAAGVVPPREAPPAIVREVVDPLTGEVTEEIVEAPASTTKKKFRRERFAEIEPGKTEWLIKHFLPAQGVGIVYGKSTVGKSFFVLDLCFRIARGDAFLGHKTRQAGVLYFAAEGQNGMRKRIKGAREKLGVQAPAFHFIGDTLNLMDADHVDALAAEAVNAGAEMAQDGLSLGMIVIDTTSASMPGGNENAGEDMSVVLQAAQRIGSAAGCVVVFIAHPGKNEALGVRGWSGQGGNVDAVYYLSPDETDPKLRIGVVQKLKDGEDGERFAYRLEQIGVGFDEDGEEITTAYPVFEDAPTTSKTSKKRRPEDRPGPAIIMRAVYQMIDEGQCCPAPRVPGVPASQLAVYRRDIRERAVRMGYADPDDKPDTIKRYINRDIAALIAANTLREEGELMWPLN